MELFGIMFSVPAAFVTSAVYAVLVRRFVAGRSPFDRALLWVSAVIVGVWAIEFLYVVALLVSNQGNSIQLIPYSIHLVLFFLIVPSTANIVQFQKTWPFVSKWYFTAAICTFTALVAVLLQYTVSEAIFGID